MGCGSSKKGGWTGDDSIHAMIVRDQKRMAKAGKTTDVNYRPRAEHPLMSSGKSQIVDPTDKTGDTAVTDNAEGSRHSKSETDSILYHSSHRGTTVDGRDKALVHEDDGRITE